MFFVSLKILLRLLNTWLENFGHYVFRIIMNCRIQGPLFSEVVDSAFCSSSIDSQARFILLENQKLKEYN